MKNEEKNKNNILVYVLIAVIAFVLGAIPAYLIGSSSNNKKENISENDNNTEKEDNNDEEIDNNPIIKEKTNEFSVQELNYFKTFSYNLSNPLNEELYNKDKVTINDLSPEYKNRLAFAYYISNVFSNGGNYVNIYEGKDIFEKYNEELDYLTSSTLEEYYKELFGKDSNYVAKNFITYPMDRYEMMYDQQKELYYASTEVGDYTNFKYVTDFFKVVEREKTIELYAYVVVYYHDISNGVDKGKIGIFKNINDAQTFTNPLKETINDKNILKSVSDNYSGVTTYSYDLSEYKNDASQYKIILEKEDNNYIFKSIEKIK